MGLRLQRLGLALIFSGLFATNWLQKLFLAIAAPKEASAHLLKAYRPDFLLSRLLSLPAKQHNSRSV